MKRHRVVAAVVIVVGLLASASGASAIPLTLVGPIAGNTIGPQSTSNPCVIAGTQCSQPAGFGFNNFTSQGNIASYNMFSTTPTANVADGVQGNPYTVAQIAAVVGLTFNIAIDVNTTNAAGETLQLFEVIVNGSPLYTYTGPTVIGGVNNNGNGFADWTLNTVSLVGRATTDTVLFHAVWNNASDGAESFFLVPGTPVAAPEPATLLLLGFGLAGVGLWARRSKKS